MCFSSGRQFFYFGGAFDLSWLPWTVENIAAEDRRRRGVTTGPQSTHEGRQWWREHAREALARVPLRDQPALAGIAPFYFDWLDHPDDGPYWHFADLESRHSQVRVPIFNFSGWHDEGYGPIGAVRNFTGLRDRAATPDARSATRLMIGPWVHGSPGTGRVGARDFTNGAAIDYPRLVLDWCDLHARGIDHGLRSEPPVRVFVMGANEWRTSPTWPLPSTARMLLRTGWPADDRCAGHGEAHDTHTFDPNHLSRIRTTTRASAPRPAPARSASRCPDVQHAAARRGRVEVIGHIEFRLWIASSAPDTDFICRLIDVEPDGTAWNLMSPTLEVLRAKYRHGEAEPVYLTPGRPEELTLRLGLTANRFLRGHRIRVQVMSSFFPHLDRNPNTGRPSAIESRLVPARQTIFHDASRPSRVILPIVGPS